MSTIKTPEQLKEIYGEPGEASIIKQTDFLTPQYRKFIEHAPFCTLATIGPHGPDCSPRGDLTGFVHVEDEKTLLLPDRRGNNRTDTLKNLLFDPKLALCFFIPGISFALRVNGQAEICVDPALLSRFEMDQKLPRTVLRITVTDAFHQCGRAVMRAKLWDNDSLQYPSTIPKPGEALAWITDNAFDGVTYDQTWEARAKKTLW